VQKVVLRLVDLILHGRLVVRPHLGSAHPKLAHLKSLRLNSTRLKSIRLN
jgi:hypothetical protein